MSDYIVTKDGELMHYGVKGMKWGHRKAQPKTAGSSRVGRAARAALQATTGVMGGPKKTKTPYGAMSEEVKGMKKPWGTIEENPTRNKVHNIGDNLRSSKSRGERKAKRILSKVEKQHKKDFIKTRSKEIQKGSSVVGKMWNAYTGGHKIQAEIEYNLRDYKD